MNRDIISDIFFSCFNKIPKETERCAVGIANYVYIVKCDDIKYILRCCGDKNAYDETVFWLKKLSAIDVPVPKVLFCGQYEEYSYLILNYIEGRDIGPVYRGLTSEEKKEIAKYVIAIQKKVSRLPLGNIDGEWSWVRFVDGMLENAEKLIVQNGYFDVQKVARLRAQKFLLEKYFAGVKPAAYLDDISTKNLLIHNGRLSGIIDIDQIGAGDDLTYIAMTYVALLNMDCDTDYAEYLLKERGCTASEMKAFWFYSLLYCVDFMGERGTQFGDKKIEVNDEIVNRLNKIYDTLWEKWREQIAENVKIIEIHGANEHKIISKTRTGCRGIVIKNSLMLISHEINSDCCLIPGGGLEENETLEECCVREIQEETGYIVKPVCRFLTMNEYYEDCKYVSHYFLCDITGEAEQHLTEAEKERGLIPEWAEPEKMLELYSNYNDFAATDEEKRGQYQREYAALSEYLKMFKI